MTARWLAAAAVVLALGACSPGARDEAGAQPKFNTDLPMTEFMGHVVDPAAQMYWNNSGSVVDEAGEKSLYPTTDEGWDVLVTGASIVMESGNVMQLPERQRAPQADWNRFSQLMTQRAREARDAAERQDPAAVFEAGANLYQACVACHEKFIVETAGAAEGDALPAVPSK